MLSLLFTILFFCFRNTYLVLAHNLKGSSKCIPKKGYDHTQCNFYKDNEWLPPKYAYATYCVCTNDDLNTPELNCVRKRLQQLHGNIDSRLKDAAKSHLSAYIDGGISEGEYDAWTDMQFGHLSKSIHDQAFEECCCPGKPANSYFWHGVFVWPQLPCTAIRAGQKLLSACN